MMSPNYEQPSLLKWLFNRVVLIYTICIFIAAIICIVLKWFSIEGYASALKYCSVGVFLFGALIVAGNSARTEIPGPNYFIPTRRAHHESVSEHFGMWNKGLLFFLISSICSVLLFGTGYLIQNLIVKA